MNPLVAIAASVLPDILKSVVGPESGVQGEGASTSVAAAVSEAAGTSDPVDARTRLEADPAAADALKVRLAEIASAEDERRQRALIDAQKLELEAAGARHKAEIDALRLEIVRSGERRQAALEDLRLGLADTAGARTALAGLARDASPLAWGAPAVSVIVAAGFFLILTMLIVRPDLPALADDSPVFQIINITVGALAAAFATVVSFWLGSSQGSRSKDAARDARLSREAAARAGDAVSPAAPVSMPAPVDSERREASNFATCMDIVLAQEGGYADHPIDPGGATNLGITRATLGAWRGKPVTRNDVKTLTRDEAREIYRANYWNALNCDALPAGADLAVFDFGVNAGTGRSARLLQRLVGVNADGVVGPDTVAAVRSRDAAGIVRDFAEGRLDFYRGLEHWPTFGRGWSERTRAVTRAALGMIG